MTFLRRHFRLYNRRYFGNRLPDVPVRWKRGLKCHGYRWIYGICHYENKGIEINARMRGLEKHALLVLLHEMIHLKLNQLRRGHPRAIHGPQFQKETVRLARLGAFKNLF